MNRIFLSGNKFKTHLIAFIAKLFGKLNLSFVASKIVFGWMVKDFQPMILIYRKGNFINIEDIHIHIYLRLHIFSCFQVDNYGIACPLSRTGYAPRIWGHVLAARATGYFLVRYLCFILYTVRWYAREVAWFL